MPVSRYLFVSQDGSLPKPLRRRGLTESVFSESFCIVELFKVLPFGKDLGWATKFNLSFWIYGTFCQHFFNTDKLVVFGHTVGSGS